MRFRNIVAPNISNVMFMSNKCSGAFTFDMRNKKLLATFQ